jgi:hypothetical protein
MRDVLPTSASEASAHPWSGLERALLVRGASSIVFSERGDVVSVRFAIDDKLVQLEVPRHGDGAGVDWPAVERVLGSKLDAVRSGRSTFAGEFPPAGSRRLGLRGGAATAAALVVALSLPLFAFGALPVPATAVRLIKAPFAPLRPDAGNRERQRPDRLIVPPPRTIASAPGHAKHGPRPQATRPEPRSASADRVAPVHSSIASTGTVAGGATTTDDDHVSAKPDAPPGQTRTPPGQAKDGPGPAAPEQANGKAKGHDNDAAGSSKPDPEPAQEHGGGSTGPSDPDGGKGSNDPGGDGDSGQGGATGSGGSGDPATGTPPDDHGNGGGESGPSGQSGGGESGPPADDGGESGGSSGKDGQIAEVLDQ